MPTVALTSLALLAVTSVQPEPTVGHGPRTADAADSYDGFDAAAAERVRLDQCLMGDALRQGGPNMFAVAKDALTLPADQLHQKADRGYPGTPMADAYDKDQANTDTWAKKTDDRAQAWASAVSGLDHYPGQPTDSGKIYEKTGLTPWLWQSYFAGLGYFFYDPTPSADQKTTDAVIKLGDSLYASATGPEADAWKAWKRKAQEAPPRSYADDSRIFLASGGFPRAAADPDSGEFRIAVEDLKSRFASCAWRTPNDPNRVLGKEVATASDEWQKEIASQTTQRQQLLTANSQAATDLRDGTYALGELLGQSWIADFTTRWQDYWSDGGVGWLGDAPVTVSVTNAAGKCLDVEGAKKDNGTPVQIYTCSSSAAQKWQIYQDDKGVHLRNTNSLKCLDVNGGSATNGTKIQISSCDSGPNQTWEANLRATTALKNSATGKCVDLHSFDNSYNAQLYTCNGAKAQQFNVKPSGHDGTVPPKTDFDKAKTTLTSARSTATKQLATLKAKLEDAKKAATTSDTAEQAAYAIADQNGAPRGRGLIVGQQKAQVTHGAVAALEAMVKAGETAEAATRASTADSNTIAQRAAAQAAQVKAEFRKEAAQHAEEQAKAAADAAKIHRDNAKNDKEAAEAQLSVALKAEGDAKTAAGDAHVKRLAAEAEEANAKAEKETAAAKQVEANQHKQNAEAQAVTAKDAKDKAEAAESTAEGKRDDAKATADHSRDMRDDAWDAEQKADSLRAKADAKKAYADSLDSDDDATAARQAANDADTAATDAENAAVKARSEADAATKAAADADAAATRAEAAAKRARAASDAAQADKVKADAAVKTATAAVAKAIKAAKDAANESRAAVKLADEAQQHAKDAKSNADAATREAAKALAAAAKAAGYAYVTAQAAVDAGKSAVQVAKPANDAIELGSPYIDIDSAAPLVVLTAQGSKTIAEQQQAVADAHAKNAQEEAAESQALADQAQTDTKEAYQHAANAARNAADARSYSKQALDYSADAASAAKKAAQSLTRTIEYDRQAAEDAAAADKAAGHAEGYAKDARDSADTAALDAEAARKAASEAEEAAKDARAAADRADTAATEAEQYAKDADKYAKEAQDSADRSEREKANQQVSTGGGTGVEGVFYVIDQDEYKVVSAKQIGECPANAPLVGCTATYELVMDVVADFYLCTDDDALATAQGCPKKAWKYLGTQTIKGDPSKPVQWAHHFSGSQIIKIGWQNLFGDTLGAVLYEIVLGDAVKCFHGSATSCAWAASMFAPVGRVTGALADAVKALDAAARTGIGFEDAWKGLRALNVSDEVIAGIGVKALKDLEEGCARALRVGVASRAAGGYCPWLELGGPGRWMPETESMSAADRAYEQMVTGGVPSGISYKVPAETKSGYVKFDGYQNGTLLDAKNQHYSDSMLTADGKLKFPTKETSTMVKQVKAANGTPVVWYMSDERTRYALEQWALENGVKGIKFVFRAGS